MGIERLDDKLWISIHNFSFVLFSILLTLFDSIITLIIIWRGRIITAFLDYSSIDDTRWLSIVNLYHVSHVCRKSDLMLRPKRMEMSACNVSMVVEYSHRIMNRSARHSEIISNNLRSPFMTGMGRGWRRRVLPSTEIKRW